MNSTIIHGLHNSDPAAFMAVGMLIIYFLPTLIAAARRHQSVGAIFALDFLLGWTAVFWLVAFIWSLSGTQRGLARELRAVDQVDRDVQRIEQSAAFDMRQGVRLALVAGLVVLVLWVLSTGHKP